MAGSSSNVDMPPADAAAPGSSGAGTSSDVVMADEATASRKRARDDDRRCIGGCGNSQCNPKRPPGQTEKEASKILWRFYELREDTDNASTNTDTSYDSHWTGQEENTATAKDSDDESVVGEDMWWRMQHPVEFEVASEHSSCYEGPYKVRGDPDTHGSDGSSTCSSQFEEAVSAAKATSAGAAVAAAALQAFLESTPSTAAIAAAMVNGEVECEEEECYYADTSSDDESDVELQPEDKWSCLRCKQTSQPIPRYCQHCFSIRKSWFPARPKASRRKTDRAEAERFLAESRKFPPRVYQVIPGTRTLAFPEPGTSANPCPGTSSDPTPGTSSSPSQTRAWFHQQTQQNLDDFLSVVKDYKNSQREDAGSQEENEKSPSEVIVISDVLGEQQEPLVPSFDQTLSDIQDIIESQTGSQELPSSSDSPEPDKDNKTLGRSIESQTNSIELRNDVPSVTNTQGDMFCGTISETSITTHKEVPKIFKICISQENSQSSAGNFSQNTSTIDEDVVDTPKKIGTSQLHAKEFSQNTNNIDEDVVDSPRKMSSSQGNSQVYAGEFSQNTNNIDEDVVDFPQKIRSSQGNSQLFAGEFSQNTNNIDEDVVDSPRKIRSSQGNSQLYEGEDMVDFCLNKNSENSRDKNILKEAVLNCDIPLSSRTCSQQASCSRESSQRYSSGHLVGVVSETAVTDSSQRSFTSSSSTGDSGIVTEHCSLSERGVPSVVGDSSQRSFTSSSSSGDSGIVAAEHCSLVERGLQNVLGELKDNSQRSFTSSSSGYSEPSTSTLSLPIPSVPNSDSPPVSGLHTCNSPTNSRISGPSNCLVSGDSFSRDNSQRSLASCSTGEGSQPREVLPRSAEITKICVVCDAAVANTAFTHGRVAHQCTCYPCAKKIYKTNGRCPICMRPASSFYKVYTT